MTRASPELGADINLFPGFLNSPPEWQHFTVKFTVSRRIPDRGLGRSLFKKKTRDECVSGLIFLGVFSCEATPARGNPRVASRGPGRTRGLIAT